MNNLQIQNAKIFSGELTAAPAISTTITAIDAENKTIDISGNHTADITSNHKILLNDKKYTVTEASINGSDTTLQLSEEPSGSIDDTVLISVISAPDLNFDVSTDYLLAEFCLGTGDVFDADAMLILDDGKRADEKIRIVTANILFSPDIALSRKLSLEVTNFETREIEFALWLKAIKANSLEAMLSSHLDAIYNLTDEIRRRLG